MIDFIFLEGLIFGLMALGVFITFRILDFPDLTVDGSFPMGGAIAAIMLVNGYHWLICIAVAFIGGILAGLITAFVHNKLKIPSLLSGILTMTMLYSINLRIMGTSNIPLFKTERVFNAIHSFLENTMPFVNLEVGTVVVIGLGLAGVLVLINLFFRTDLGLTLGALGDNQQMIISNGINPDHLKLIGVGLSNGLVAMAGAVFAQYQGAGDITLGTGMIVNGLAIVMIGEFLGKLLRMIFGPRFLKENKISSLTIQVILGAFAYQAIMYVGRLYGYVIGLNPGDLKLITGVLIIALLAVSKLKGKDELRALEKRKGGALESDKKAGDK